jgi:hypothetical protein
MTGRTGPPLPWVCIGTPSGSFPFSRERKYSPFASPAVDLVEEVLRTVRETMDLKALT